MEKTLKEILMENIALVREKNNELDFSREIEDIQGAEDAILEAIIKFADKIDIPAESLFDPSLKCQYGLSAAALVLLILTEYAKKGYVLWTTD